MPELDARYGYPICLAVMFGLSVVQISCFWKRGWFQDWTGMR